MRLYATKSPEGRLFAIGAHEAEACYRTSIAQLEDRWEVLASKGWTVVPVSLTELSEPKEDSHG